MLRFGQWRKSTLGDDIFERTIDGEGYTFHRQYTQDAQPLIDHNTAVRNETGGWNADRTARKVGSVPVTIVYDKIREWTAQGKLPARTDPAYSHTLNRLLVDLLRDRDYAKFRTTDRV